ncbi:MAG: hypothetical protein V4515_14985 [Chloroflexota bacterium]
MARRGTAMGKAGEISVLDHVLALLAESDLRYQQRFDAQTRALDAALLAAEKAVQTALTAAEKAVTKAEIAAEKRFDAVNEFRGAYQDIIAQQMPRNEAEQRLTAMAEKIDDLKGSSRAGAVALWSYLVGAAGIVIAVVAFATR